MTGHVGYARYLGGAWNGLANDVANDGVANDVGLSLDLRLLGRLVVGAHVGYDVITVWQSFAMYDPALPTAALADRWVGSGVHAGVLFWGDGSVHRPADNHLTIQKTPPTPT